MDLLHFLDVHQLDPPEIQILDELPKYDEGPFMSYLSRRGTTTAELIADSMRISEENTYENLLQIANYRTLIREWLIFGLLFEFHSMFGLKFHRHHFEKQHNGKRYVSLKPLVTLTEDLILKYQHVLSDNSHPAVSKVLERHRVGAAANTGLGSSERPKPTQRTGLRNLFQPFKHLRSRRENPSITSSSTIPDETRFMKCVDESSEFLGRLWHWRLGYPEESEPKWDIYLWVAARICVETLYRILLLLTQKNLVLKSPPPTSLVWWGRCREAGQCPSRLDDVLRHSVSDAYFVSSLKIGEPDKHQQCGVSRCKLPDVPLTSMMPRHTLDCAGFCASYWSELEFSAFLEGPLDNGSYPVIAANLSGGPAFKVVDWNVSKPRYIAISHVWTHGLGNPDANSLSHCKFNHFAKHMIRIPGMSEGFWIDTLCVPLSQNYRRLAISRMAQVYKNAAAVLVLDEQLLKTGANPTERAMRLLICDWMTRLWTLQEAFLAGNRLWFAFADGVVNVNDLLTQHLAPTQLDTSILLHRAYLTAAVALSGSYMIEELGKDRLLSLAEAFSSRRTTKPVDEVFCLATLMEIDILSLPETPTLAAVYKSLEALPEDLLFCPGRRLDDDGFRWAPASLLSQSQIAFQDNQKIGTLLGSGFQVFKPAIRFKADFNLPMPPTDPSKGVQPGFLVYDGLDLIFSFEPASAKSEHEDYTCFLQPRLIVDGALILQTELIEAGKAVLAVLVGQVRRTLETNFCRFELAVFGVQPRPSQIDSIKRLRKVYELQGQVEESEYWCVE